MTVEERLKAFTEEHGFRGKGPLSVAIVVTEQAKSLPFPLAPETLLTGKGGQVKGLGGEAVQSVLKRHGITRVLAREGGRTSRGSIERMRSYVGFLNSEAGTDPAALLEAAERHWVASVREFFNAKPLTLRVDSGRALRLAIRELMGQAEQRQREVPGTRILGSMLQHLVGAKLEIIMGAGAVAHNSSTTNDEKEGRTGDFDLGDVSVHVSTAPSEALLQKCHENIKAGRRPVIVTTQKGVSVAEGLAENLGIGANVDVIEFEQFLTSNIYEHGRFAADARRVVIDELVSGYNRIVDEFETDPSLKIEVAKGR